MWLITPIANAGTDRKQLLHANAGTGMPASGMDAAGIPHIEIQHMANEMGAMIVVGIGEPVLAEVRDRLAKGFAKLHGTISALVKWDLSIMALRLNELQGT
ncbi:hypothetical protein [Pseudomonas sp. NFX224]|uniref:hypothetical protein n=1 Tax=Pseudomonas sp. NFX224 TaxID=3402862 RepID=UPI003AFA759F